MNEMTINTKNNLQMRKLFLMVLLSVGLSLHAKDDNNLRLWYARPATAWTEALPVGNSHLGAMVYGGTSREEIAFNEETFWAGGPYDNNNPDAIGALPEVRRMVFEGRFKDAENRLNATFMTPRNGMRFLTLGSLLIDIEGVNDATDYYRDLDLATATATTRYTVGGTAYTRTVFASMADNAVVVRIDRKSVV